MNVASIDTKRPGGNAMRRPCYAIGPMRVLPLALSLLLALLPAMQAYGKTMAGAHCRTHGHASTAASQASHGSTHAQHQADASSLLVAADAQAGGADCHCGCLCAVACSGGAALSDVSCVAAVAPSHEPWHLMTDTRHPWSVHDSLLRPPRFS